MKNRSLRFKMITGGVISVLVPLLIVGGFSIYKSGRTIEELTTQQGTEIAKGLAHAVNMAMKEELKIAAQVATRDVVIAAATKRGQSESDRATAELTAMVKQSGNEYETILIAGNDGKIFADGVSGKNKGIDISGRDYFKAAIAGKVSVGSVVKSKGSGNIVLTFGAPVYSKSKEVIGVVASVININFLLDIVSATKLGETGYG